MQKKKKEFLMNDYITSENKITYEKLESEKSKVIFRLFTVNYAIVILSLAMGAFFSDFPSDEKIMMYIVAGASFVLIMLALMIIKYVVKSYKVKNRFFVALAFLYVLLTSYATQRDHILGILPALIIMMSVLIAAFNMRYMIYYLIGFALIVVALFLREPHALIEVSFSIIYRLIIMAFTVTYSYSQLIKLFNWYELSLREEIDAANQNNMELQALNEEYYAVQEEIIHQFDEITKINEENSLLLSQSQAVFSATEDGIIIFNVTKNETQYSDLARKLLGIKKDEEFELDGTTETKRIIQKVTDRVLKGENQKDTVEVDYMIDGKEYRYRVTLFQYSSQETEDDYMLYVMRDITTEYNQSKNIYNLAYYNQLTGLKNWASLIEYMKKELIPSKKPFYFLMLDIDNMRYFNDTFGHDVGDEIIKSVARGLENLKEPYVAAQFESDGFGLAIPGDIDPVKFLAGINLRKRKFFFEGTSFDIHLSVGIAEYKSGYEAADILTAAEIAMFKVKESGKNGYAFYQENFLSEVSDKLYLTTAMEEAIEKEEMYMVYQPICLGETGKPLGFEALVRWKSEKLGFVSPVDFIPLAEQTGYIHELGVFIIDQVCQFIKELSDKGSDQYVSINLSGKQLIEPNFAERLIKTFEKYDLPSKNLVVEVTESAIVERLEEVCLVLDKIRDYGVKVYLDDFGTGYSSLNYLSKLPIDCIKIDKSFVDFVHVNERSEVMVRSIIYMAKNFKMNVVAEGVEYLEQKEKLEELGCDWHQGYYYYRPLEKKDAINV